MVIIIIVSAQRMISKARESMKCARTITMGNEGNDESIEEEHEFWVTLRESCLLPEETAFNNSGMNIK